MKIAIIGLGLIGGSWGLALKEWAKTEEGRSAQLEIVGFDAKGAQRSLADKMKAVDRTVSSPMDAAKDAQIVIIATPVMAVRETFEDIANVLPNGAIVTDTASTKRDVLQWAKELLPITVSFVGGHPMAGKTASLEEATAKLFKDCTYCLVPAPNAKEEAIEAVSRLVEIIGAKAHFIDADEHDSYVAAISHLPYIAAVSLVKLASESEGWREMGRLASTGFQDTTRVAMATTSMFLDICRTNSDAIIGWIDRYQRTLNEMKTLLEQAGLHDNRGRSRPAEETDFEPLKAVLEQLHDTREKWQIDKAKGVTEFELPGIDRKEITADYGRWITGGLFKKRKPDDEKK